MKTTSFELSKKIKRLGIKHDTYFVWCKTAGNSNSEPYIISFDELARTRGRHDAICVAFTLDELLEMLPCEFSNTNYVLSISGKLPESYYEIGYYLEEDGSLSLLKKDCLHIVLHKNPAEAAGHLLCWCVENGYVEVGDINKEDRQL